MKYLLWAVVIYVAWRWITAPKKPQPDPLAENEPDVASTAEATGSAPEKMVSCAQCGIHLPVSEALTGVNRQIYCSEEHRQQHGQAIAVQTHTQAAGTRATAVHQGLDFHQQGARAL